MRFATLATVPFLLSVASASYYVDCGDGKGHHEKHEKSMKPKEHTPCQKFGYGMKEFDWYKDDNYSYKFEFYEDDKCTGKKHEHKDGKKKKHEHSKKHVEKPCWSYKVYCE